MVSLIVYPQENILQISTFLIKNRSRLLLCAMLCTMDVTNALPVWHRRLWKAEGMSFIRIMEICFNMQERPRIRSLFSITTSKQSALITPGLSGIWGRISVLETDNLIVCQQKRWWMLTGPCRDALSIIARCIPRKNM